MPLKRIISLAALGLSGILVLGGCTVGQSAPPPPRPFGVVEREERGEVVSVHDTMIDLRTGQARSIHSSGPRVPMGPVAVSVPITIGGEKRHDVPGEEITVSLPSGKLILVVQELSEPAFAKGEQVRVLHEEPDVFTRVSRTRVVREDDPTPAPVKTDRPR